MGAYVSLEEPRPGEALAAEVALAALVVGAHVHAERGYADVDLVAVGTAAGLLVAERAVGLPVPRQVRRRRVLLAAVRALVLLAAGPVLLLLLLSRRLSILARSLLHHASIHSFNSYFPVFFFLTKIRSRASFGIFRHFV